MCPRASDCLPICLPNSPKVQIQAETETNEPLIAFPETTQEIRGVTDSLVFPNWFDLVLDLDSLSKSRGPSRFTALCFLRFQACKSQV